jgi:hypothetical protein
MWEIFLLADKMVNSSRRTCSTQFVVYLAKNCALGDKVVPVHTIGEYSDQILAAVVFKLHSRQR